MKQKLYICGKITGLSELEYKSKFASASEKAKAAGYVPVNTCDLPIRERMVKLLECDKVYVIMDSLDDEREKSLIRFASLAEIPVIYKI